MVGEAMMRRTVLKLLAGGLAIGASGLAPGAWAADFEPEKQVDDMRVYLGVLPSELISHSLREQEDGGIPRGRGWHHVLVALFDNKTGERITDADVTARVEGVAGVQSGEKRLEPMQIAGSPSFGNFFLMPGRDPYSIHLKINRHGH